MRSLWWFLTLVFLCYNLQGVVLAEEKVIKKTAKEMPIELQLFKKETLESFPGIKTKIRYFTWMTAKQISMRLRQSEESVAEAEKKNVIPKWVSTEKETVTEAKRMAEKWIRTIIKDCWIPDDIQNRLLAIDSSDANDYDTICIRYEMRGYYIQIIQGNIEISVTIKPTKPKVLLYSEAIDLFFMKSTEIKENTLFQPIEGFQHSSYGKPHGNSKETKAENQYWGHTYGWANGESCGFLFMKYYGGKGIPIGLPKDWF